MSNFRVRVTFQTRKERDRVAQLFNELSCGHGEQVATAAGEDETILLYANSHDGADQLLRTLRANWRNLNVEPVGVAIDEWIPEDQRWSAEPSKSGSAVHRFLSDLLDALFLPPR